jgi:hypothetical protein
VHRSPHVRRQALDDLTVDPEDPFQVLVVVESHPTPVGAVALVDVERVEREVELDVAAASRDSLIDELAQQPDEVVGELVGVAVGIVCDAGRPHAVPLVHRSRRHGQLEWMLGGLRQELGLADQGVADLLQARGDGRAAGGLEGLAARVLEHDHLLVGLEATERDIHAAGEERAPEFAVGHNVESGVDLLADGFPDEVVLQRSQLIRDAAPLGHRDVRIAPGGIAELVEQRLWP